MLRVWDPFVRVFHWGLVAIVVANRFLNDTGGEWHEWLGYAACALIALRIAWGFAGSGYARFSEIAARWPARGRFAAHARDHFLGRLPRSIGHPPVAVVGMALLLLCVLLLGLTGWMLSWDAFFGEDWLMSVHLWISNSLLALALLHVAGVLRESWLHRENLVAAMIHGRKRP